MIEAVLLQHLQQQPELVTFLSTYAGKAAVFNQEAPPDTDRLWSKEQYGRLVFFLNMQDDPARKISGQLEVDLICKTGEQIPEEIEPFIKEAIDGYFFTSDKETFAAQWSASNYFTEPTQKTNGVTVIFDLLAFPYQETCDPDPVQLINNWTKQLMPTCSVIGRDTVDAVFKPDDERPAVYWRQTAISKCSWIPDTYHCSWLTSTLQGHIFTAEQNIAHAIARTIEHKLTIAKRLIFPDNAPLMVDRNIRLNLTTDALRNGQITLDATYGILNIEETPPILEHLFIDEREVAADGNKD
jgi:hypothetical protein